MIEWPWAEDPAYLAMPDGDQQRVAEIMDKMRPHLPASVSKALEGLSNKELDLLEAFYLASEFGNDQDEADGW